MQADAKLTRRKDMNKLRRRMDGDDGFMNAHQIKKIRTREREVPAWTLNDEEVRKVLLRAFPGLRHNRTPVNKRAGRSRQANRSLAQRAGRWTRILHLYYRVQMSNSQVAKEMGETLNAIKMTLKSIRRVARGRRANNIAPLGLRPRGRPKKNR